MFYSTLFASVAWAADVAEASSPNPVMTILPFLAIFAVFYFLMIRPQQKRQREHQAMLNSVSKGDMIQTSGGLLGKVTGEDKEKGELTLEIAPQIRVKIGRGYIAKIIRGDGSPAPKK